MVPGADPKRSGNSLIYFDNLNVIFSHTPEATPLRSFTLGSMPFGRTFGVPTPDFFARMNLPSATTCYKL